MRKVSGKLVVADPLSSKIGSRSCYSFSLAKILSGIAPANQTKKGQNEKFMNFAPHFFVNSGVFPWENTGIHIELLFRNAPVKSS